MRFVYKDKPIPKQPVIDMCEDRVTLPVAGVAETVPAQESPIQPAWQRWNDYGIANLLEGEAGEKKGNYRQAEAAFRALLTLGAKDAVSHGHINLARVFIDEGRLTEAAEQLQLSGKADPPPPWWTRAWLTGVVNSETAAGNADLEAAIAELERIVDPNNQPRERGFDFTRDYLILNLIANRYFKRAQGEEPGTDAQRRFLLKAVDYSERTLAIDPDNVEAHDLLKQCYGLLSGPPGVPGHWKPVEFTQLPDLALKAADKSSSKNDRLHAADHLRRGLEGVSKQPARADQPKLNALRTMWKGLRPAYHAEPDAELKAALASALTALHQEFHTIFKPDEVAQSVRQAYRAKHPAADYAARDRVVYPTTRAHKDTIRQRGELVSE
jgi:tetratricopeptide (TPR) repeat protein